MFSVPTTVKYEFLVGSGEPVAHRDADGSLPSDKVIAARYGRHERWGRLGTRGRCRAVGIRAEPTG